ncbi:ABC transporter ATP-binding protein [Schlesneria paludicola]|uniref:ABC transporter ATP-binding protein n=1 Tax=Schlesneria paludicola TaxID=360056 RepID=UPI00029AB5BD|nr:ABC transporter ATP-binding protein [Schlesneria paludicola]
MNALSRPLPASPLVGSEAEFSGLPPIVCEGLRKRFGHHEVLSGVDLTIPAGAVVGLVGTNGAGKSTLINCLLGLLKPTGGNARIWGEDPWFLSARAKSNLGYVPQTVQLQPWMRVEQLLDFTAAFYEHWDHRWTETLLTRLDLPREQRVGPLSVGQQQKLALALALGHRPSLLILDEPVASLDPIARRELLATLMELALDNRHTVLFSTHITSDLERIATHVAVLREGKIVLFDELDSVKDRVKRLRLTASSPFPERLMIRAAIRTQVDGCHALATVTDLSDDLLAELRQKFNATISVEDLNLEDIFVELHQRPSEHVGGLR